MSRAGRQLALRRRLQAARDEHQDRALIGVLLDRFDESHRILVTTRAPGLHRRDRRRLVDFERADAALAEHVDYVESVTGRPTIVFHREEKEQQNNAS